MHVLVEKAFERIFIFFTLVLWYVAWSCLAFKLLLRYLPPTLSDTALRDQIDAQFAGHCNWLYDQYETEIKNPLPKRRKWLDTFYTGEEVNKAYDKVARNMRAANTKTKFWVAFLHNKTLVIYNGMISIAWTSGLENLNFKLVMVAMTSYGNLRVVAYQQGSRSLDLKCKKPNSQ